MPDTRDLAEVIGDGNPEIAEGFDNSPQTAGESKHAENTKAQRDCNTYEMPIVNPFHTSVPVKMKYPMTIITTKPNSTHSIFLIVFMFIGGEATYPFTGRAL